MTKMNSLLGKMRRTKGTKNIVPSSRFQRLQGEEIESSDRPDQPLMSSSNSEGGAENFVLHNHSSMSDISLDEAAGPCDKVRTSQRSSEFQTESGPIVDTAEIDGQIGQHTSPDAYETSESDSSDEDSVFSLIWSATADGAVSPSTREVQRFIRDEDFHFEDQGASGIHLQPLNVSLPPVAVPSEDERCVGEDYISDVDGNTTTDEKTTVNIENEDYQTSLFVPSADVRCSPRFTPGVEGNAHNHDGFQKRSSPTKPNRVGELIKMFEDGARGEGAIDTRGSNSPFQFRSSAQETKPMDSKVATMQREADVSKDVELIKTKTPGALPKQQNQFPTIERSSTFEKVQFYECKLPGSRGSFNEEARQSDAGAFPELDRFDSFTADLIHRMKSEVEEQPSRDVYSFDEDGYDSLLDAPRSRGSSIFLGTHSSNDQAVHGAKVRKANRIESIVSRNSHSASPAMRTSRTSPWDSKRPHSEASEKEASCPNAQGERLRAMYEKKKSVRNSRDKVTPRLPNNTTSPSAIGRELPTVGKLSRSYQFECLGGSVNTPREATMSRDSELTFSYEMDEDGIPFDRTPFDEDDEIEATIEPVVPGDLPFDEGYMESVGEEETDICIESREDFQEQEVNNFSPDESATVSQDNGEMDSPEGSDLVVEQQESKVMEPPQRMNTQLSNDDPWMDVEDLSLRDAVSGSRDTITSWDLDGPDDTYESFEQSDSRDEQQHHHHLQPSQYRDSTNGLEATTGGNDNNNSDGAMMDVNGNTKSMKLRLPSSSSSPGNGRRKSRHSRRRSREEDDDWPTMILRILIEAREPCGGAMRLCGA